MNGGSAPSTASRQRLAGLPAPRLPTIVDADMKTSHLPSSSTFPPSFPSALSSSSLNPSASPQSSISSVVLSRYHSRHSTLVLSLILLLVLIVYVMTERGLLTGSNSPLLSASSLSALNNASVTQSYFGSSSLASNSTHRTRVVYCIVDGLRYDTLTTNPTLSSFVSSLGSDALVFPLQAQIPTISIPNWITLLTGMSPTMHGRTGNDDTSLLPFSTIFSSTLSQSRPNGLSASEWWALLVYPSLTPFRGDGSFSDEVDWGEEVFRRGESCAVRDQFSTDRLLQAVHSEHQREGQNSRFDYELFLAYWEDVDAESHAWGGTSEQSQQAASTIVGHISRAMQEIWQADQWSSQQEGGVQWQTIFIITSDHGHVDVGGHGGDVDVLSTVPFIVFSNHSGIANATSHFPPTPPSYRVSTCDIATTIAALCGVPVPRQSEGMFLPAVLSPFVDIGHRAWLHYFDLFMQKRALVMEVVAATGQGHVLTDDLIAVPSPPSNGNYTAALPDLNDRVDRLVDVMKQATHAQLSSQLALNWSLSALLTLLVLLPLLCWVFDRRTFLTVSAIFPQQVSSSCFHLWYLVRLCLVRSYRKVGGHAALPSSTFHPPPNDALRLNRVASLTGFVLVSLWVLLMLFQFLVLFHFSYRSDPSWRWQFTLFNSPYDAYVLIFGYCIFASLLVCIILHIATVLVMRSPRLMNPLLHYIPLTAGQELMDAKPATSSQSTDSSPRASLQVLRYFVTMWSSWWSCVLVVLFLFSQSYHCLLLPSWSTVAQVTPSIWSHRFQSFNFSFMLLMLQFYALLLAAHVDWRLHQLMWRTVRDSEEGEGREGDEERKKRWTGPLESWKREKHAVLWELGRLKGVEAKSIEVEYKEPMSPASR